MQVTLEENYDHVLGIPYGGDDTPERRFWNLKKDPSLIERVPELADCPELRQFVLWVNSAESRFCTFGCEKWETPVQYGNGATHEAGLYVDLSLDLAELASRENVLQLFEQLSAYGADLRAKDEDSDLTLVRVVPQRAGFHDKNLTTWFASLWIYGVGTDSRIAQRNRARGLEHIQVVLRRASDEIRAFHGTPGTGLLD